MASRWTVLSRPGGGYYTITVVGGTAAVDLANGLYQRIVLSATPVTILDPVYTGGTLHDGLDFTLLLDQDATGGRLIPTFATGAGGFAADVGGVQIDGHGSTRTSYRFLRLGGIWGLDSWPVTGGSITWPPPSPNLIP